MIPGPHFFIEILQIIYLVICHYLNIASRFADRLILLSKGVIGADGTSEEVITKENIKNVYDMDTEIITVDESPISSTMPTRITTWDAVRDTWDRPRDNMTYDAILMIRGRFGRNYP